MELHFTTEFCKRYYQVLSTFDACLNYLLQNFTRLNVKKLNASTSMCQVGGCLNQTGDGEWIVSVIHDVSGNGTEFSTIARHMLDEMYTEPLMHKVSM